MSEERSAWDRRTKEPTKDYERFRLFRDLGPRRTIREAAEVSDISLSTMQKLHARWDWGARATAWDDHVSRIEDEERVQAVRDMHRNHSRAGRAALQVGLRALQNLNPDEMSAAETARLVELGARLEREGLTADAAAIVIDPAPVAEDPWERIARELAG